MRDVKEAKRIRPGDLCAAAAAPLFFLNNHVFVMNDPHQERQNALLARIVANAVSLLNKWRALAMKET